MTGNNHRFEIYRQEAIHTRRGSTLILVMIMALILLAAAGGMVAMSNHQTHDRGRYETYKDEFAAAEVAVNKAFAHTQFMITYGTPDVIDEIDKIKGPTVKDIVFDTFDITQTFDGYETVTEGQWKGLDLYRIRYDIDVTARATDNVASRINNPGATIKQTMELTYIPLYLYAIFYDPIMEIAPGPYMEVNGMVHANGDMYIQSGGGLDFRKAVSSAGDINHGRHPDAGESTSWSDVRFTDGSGMVSMNDSGNWLDSTDADWLAESTARWNRNVQDQAHGVTELSLPIPPVADPHTIIERSDPSDPISIQNEKFENKADLKIVRESDGDVVGYDAYGNVVDLTYEYTDPDSGATETKAIYSETSFYDAREGEWVNSIDVDLSLMIESGIIPANGIVYATNEDDVGGSGKPGVVRVVNGAELPQSGVAEGFTIASDDPMYIQGDYNTVNQTLSMVASDALNILSNNWDDANSNNYSNRKASETTVNAVALHGIVPSESNNYSGGVENNFRFLEQWSGKDFNFNGSIVVLWESQKATGRWSYGSPIYTAPVRKWAWDTALGGINGPPGAPRVVEIKKKSWKLES